MLVVENVPQGDLFQDQLPSFAALCAGDVAAITLMGPSLENIPLVLDQSVWCQEPVVAPSPFRVVEKLKKSS